MKLQPICELFIIFLLVFPPITVTRNSTTMPLFSLSLFLTYICYSAAGMIRFYTYYAEFPENRYPGKTSYITSALFGILLLFLLICNMVLWNFIGSATGFVSGTDNPDGIAYPVQAIKTVCFICAAAWYEEVLYRLYTPAVITRIINASGIKHKTVFRYTGELCVILLFALGHLGNGIIAVCHAFCAGVLFRTVFVKTRHISVTVCTHAFFNLLQLWYLQFVLPAAG